MNPNGIGSIHVRVSPKTKKKVYDVKYRVEDKNTGKMLSKTKRGFTTKAAAQEYLSAVSNEIREGTYVVPSNVLVRTLTKEWLVNYEASGMRENTVSWHFYNIKHIDRMLGNKAVQTLKYETILDFIKHLKGYRDGDDKVLSPTTISHIIRTMKQVCDYALEKGLLKENPARHKRVGQALTQLKKTKEPRVVPVMKQADIIHIISNTSDSTFAIVIALAGLAGLRMGEIRGLEFSHLQGDSIVVCQQMDRRRNIEPLKTERSRRTVPLHPFVRTLIEKEQNRRKEIEKQLGEKVFTQPYVIVNTDNLKFIGQPPSFSYYGDRLEKLIDEFPSLISEDTTLHDFRHSYGSNLIYAETPIPQVSEWMGHANTATTLSVYTHVINSMRTENKEKYFASVDRDLQSTNANMGDIEKIQDFSANILLRNQKLHEIAA